MFISQQGGSYKRSTLVMMTAVAIRKTGVISGCAFGNQPVSMTNFDNGATCITSGDKRGAVKTWAVACEQFYTCSVCDKLTKMQGKMIPTTGHLKREKYLCRNLRVKS